MAYTTIDDPSLYFQIALYTGNGNTGKNIPLSSANFTGEYVGQDIQPDWIWIKQRGATTDHGMFDSSRGVTKNLKTNVTDAESTEAQSVTAFGSNDFTLGNSGDYNGADDEHVAWIWKANAGTTTTNAAGANGADHESVFQANDTAGFSIVTYTSDNQSGDTIIKHGLSTAPTFMIHKSRNGTDNWWVFHEDLTLDGFLQLNSTVTNQDGSTNVWRNTAPTSSVFKVGLDSIAPADGRTMVAYCFAPIQGYSKFGKYKGNGNDGGPFVYTGFKPSWLIVKRTDDTNSWVLFDNKRNAFNVTSRSLKSNESDAEENSSSANNVDLLSNGFKLRDGNNDINASGGTYVYMAFAEHPFVSSKGVPTTAR